MAEFTKEAATIEEVYIRRVLANGDSEYLRRPYNLVTYDNGEQYVEPVSMAGGPYTYYDVNSPATSATMRIVDVDPYFETQRIR